MKALKVFLRFVKLSLAMGFINGFKLAVIARIRRRLIRLNLRPFGSPFFIRGRTTDDTVIEQVFGNREYPLLDGFNPETIIDAGANCGAASAYFAGFYPGADIVALEPESSNFAVMAKNLRNVRGVVLLKGALWSRKCGLRISKEDSAKYAFRVEEVEVKGQTDHGVVDAFTVDEILEMRKWRRIDLLKLDIEGSELEIFSKNFENWIKKVKVIFVELHEEYAPGCGKALFAALQGLDYRIGICGEHLVIRLS